jgi:hypothetical protein
MLCRAPLCVTKTLDIGYNGDKRDMGVTTEPTGATPPTISLVVHTEGNDYKVQCTLTAAVEGTNQSVYLGPGSYATGIAWWAQSNGFGPTGPGKTEVWGIVDALNSNRSRDAELEHCNDWVRAHKLTLEAAEDAIRHAIPGLQNRRFDSRAAAYAGALQAFVGHSPHKKIAAVFQESIAATAQQHDFFPQKFKDGLVKLFLDIGNQTAARDQKGWHHFEFGPTVPTSELGMMDKLKASSRDYRKVRPSGTFKVGTEASDKVIKLPD